MDDHQIKKQELESVGELSKVCADVVLKCFYLARTGRPDILWSVNKFARSVTKWTRARDRRLARLISYIHHTSDYLQYCHVGNTAQHSTVDWGYLKTRTLLEILKIRNQHLEEFCENLGSRTYVPISSMCKKQTSESHSSRKSETISLDAGLRMHGLPTFDLWDIVIDVLRSTKGNANLQCQQLTGNWSDTKY